MSEYFTWNERIDRAQELGTFRPEDKFDALSSVDSPLGERINGKSENMSIKARKLLKSFFYAVYYNHFNKARKIRNIIKTLREEELWK